MKSFICSDWPFQGLTQYHFFLSNVFRSLLESLPPTRCIEMKEKQHFALSIV